MNSAAERREKWSHRRGPRSNPGRPHWSGARLSGFDSRTR